ncbi:NF-kappa-B inhibitor zeta [Chanos chanos]|uniref:NF-kappa-B inhibitor zeta n=1 Tax=Chanos chanos TaxID=29144 RepID=A0A6J2VPG4_CHACN|nr:NF-kappa-B inhibitor zeta-like [Chanos chanos]
MVSSQVETTERKKMQQHRRERRNRGDGFYSCDSSPMPGSPPSKRCGSDVSGINRSHSDVYNSSKPSTPKTEKRYLGVRVRMPVRDMLRNIRIAKGMDPKEIQGKSTKASKGDKKRVNTNGERRNALKKHQTKGLEELAIIVEVLEEDLRTSRSHRQANKLGSSTLFSEQKGKSFGEDVSSQNPFFRQKRGNEQSLSPSHSWPSENSPTYSVEDYNFFPSPAYSQCINQYPSIQGGYSSDESDDYRCSDQYGMAYSPSSYEYQVPSPTDSAFTNPELDCWSDYQESLGGPWPCSLLEKWENMVFFRTQMEREESLLREVSDRELLAMDENGKTYLHKVVEEGRRAVVYVVAKRMAALKKLDAKDAEGKTPLHLATQKNQHLMVADLISLGADVNERDKYGKTCLHLAAERGYVRVLEVLKNAMKNGMYIELEAREMNGRTALQCAAVALNSSVCGLELSIVPSQVRLHNLRQEQMMETLECLLQMECNLHSLDHQLKEQASMMKPGMDSLKCEQFAHLPSREDKAMYMI